MEDIHILKKFFFFRDLTTLELAKINSVVHTPSFGAGEVLIREGVKSDSLYVIRKGRVTVTKAEREIARLGEGDLAGEISFLDGGEPSATVTATEETACVEIPGGALEELLSENVDIAAKVYRAFISTLCRRLRNADDLIAKNRLLLLSSGH